MKDRKYLPNLSSITCLIIFCSVVKFAIHMHSAREYGFFGEELYIIALSRRLALGYVDLPRLVPALVALSRILLGDSLFAYYIFPALPGAVTLSSVYGLLRNPCPRGNYNDIQNPVSVHCTVSANVRQIRVKVKV